MSQSCSILHQADVHIRHWRCVTTDADVPVDTLDADGRALLDTFWAAWSYLAGLITAGTLISGVDCQHAELLSPPRLDPPQGGSAGWLIIVRLDLTPLLLDAAS